jgi:hypothetical protein
MWQAAQYVMQPLTAHTPCCARYSPKHLCQPGECDKYPCPESSPLCVPDDRIACLTEPCPQRNCISCNSVLCAAVACRDPMKAVILPGQCCPTCVADCSNVACPAIACAPGFKPVYQPSQCCLSSCVADCSNVECQPCPPGSMRAPRTDAHCCTCTKQPLDACSNAVCSQSACGPGFIAVTQPGDCCASCVYDCSGVECPEIACAAGFSAQYVDGQCCPTCKRQSCLHQCPLLGCPPNTIAFTTAGECCPSGCIPRSSAASIRFNSVLVVAVAVLGVALAA